jgi:NADH dehydrogenase FAD-containing subunit
MGKQLVLVGAGHAHLSTFLNLHNFVRQGHRPLVISPHPHYTYSGMGPGVLSGMYTPLQGRIDIRRLVELRGIR